MALAVRSGTISLEVCGGQSGSGIGLSLSTLHFLCQYDSTAASYSASP